ncbi:MAG: winged helix-turn-helix transcriptional regulator [Candidatus Thermoplasmatota archaeon]
MAFLLVLGLGLGMHAITASAEEPAAPALAFGDHGEYRVMTMELATGISGQAVMESLNVDAGAPATVADRHGLPAFATPIVFSFEHETLDGRGQVAWTYWVTENDVVVAVGKAGAATMSQGEPGLPGAADSSQPMSWSRLEWGQAALPCGFSLLAQGKVPACASAIQPGTPWPTVVTWPTSDLLGSAGPGQTVHRLELVESGRSVADWSAPAAVAALPRLTLEPRGVPGPTGDGPGAFGIVEALDALRSAPADSAAGDLLERPDAYVAYARLYTATDAAGLMQETWHLVVAAGPNRVERVVIREPAALDALPSSLRVAGPDALDYPIDPPPSVLPPLTLAPTKLPALGGLNLAFAAATGKEPTAWGFSIACTTISCTAIRSEVQVFAETFGAARPSTERWQRPLASSAVLRVAGDGGLLAVEQLELGEARPDLLSDGPFEPAAQVPDRRAPFPEPSSPAAVTVGIVSLIAAFLAVAWPSLKVAIPLFSRIEASRMLDHPLRRRVHDLVHEEPGIHPSQVAQRLGISSNTAIHHLNRLSGAGYLGERQIGAYHCYFPRGSLDERLQEAVPVLKSRGAQAVLLAVEVHGAPSFKGLMAATGLGYATVHHHAQRLWKAGLLASERDGKARRFRLTEFGRRLAHEANATLEGSAKRPKKDRAMDGLA